MDHAILGLGSLREGTILYSGAESEKISETSCYVSYKKVEKPGAWTKCGGWLGLPCDSFLPEFLYGLAHIGFFDPPYEGDYFTPEPKG